MLFRVMRHLQKEAGKMDISEVIDKRYGGLKLFKEKISPTRLKFEARVYVRRENKKELDTFYRGMAGIPRPEFWDSSRWIVVRERSLHRIINSWFPWLDAFCLSREAYRDFYTNWKDTLMDYALRRRERRVLAAMGPRRRRRKMAPTPHNKEKEFLGKFSPEVIDRTPALRKLRAKCDNY
jgi:hypothetical protein